MLKALLVVCLASVVSRFLWAWFTAARIEAATARSASMEFGPLGETGFLGREVRSHFAFDRWLPSSVFDLAFLPVRECQIYGLKSMPGDLGRELGALRQLRKIHIRGMGQKRCVEADWVRLMGGLRHFPELVELELYGDQITDAVLAPLEGHPRLETLTVEDGKLTAASMKTFQRLPHLNGLYIFGNTARSDIEMISPLSSEDLSNALPSVKIEYSSPHY